MVFGISLELGCWCLEFFQLIVNPPVSVNVGACDCPGGIPNVTTTFCAPVEAFDGITNVATTVPWVESEMFVPLMLPMVTLVTGAPAGGKSGGDVSVMVTVTVEPRLALPPGATEPVENVVVPALSKVATDVRPTR